MATGQVLMHRYYCKKSMTKYPVKVRPAYRLPRSIRSPESDPPRVLNPCSQQIAEF